ncbi:glycosyltransferase [Persicobacter psychrovividus]|uniref:Glycosyltransferase n=1 Tax=Persicobacter psychrovividus TaxID=387638 RepID=A0ABN6L4M0_9BACT|nr:hypothetical protein PEPS_03400 [Persicobacter psychrovividus]
MKASVIVSFYNNVAWLKLVLAGFSRQSEQDFEVIIADDGSRAEVVREVKGMCNDHIRHLWHEDLGWRKNSILNKAIRSSKADFLIFIDGDCIPHQHFVRDHLAAKKAGIVNAGRRVMLSLTLTEKLSAESILEGQLNQLLMPLFKATLRGEKVLLSKHFRLQKRGLRKLLRVKSGGLKGCNWSVLKQDIERINGFDERYQNPTIGEDDDLEYRFGLLGIAVIRLRFSGILYHCHHALLSRVQPENKRLFQSVKEQKEPFTPYGLEKTTA